MQCETLFLLSPLVKPHDNHLIQMTFLELLFALSCQGLFITSSLHLIPYKAISGLFVICNQDQLSFFLVISSETLTLALSQLINKLDHCWIQCIIIALSLIRILLNFLSNYFHPIMVTLEVTCCTKNNSSFTLICSGFDQTQTQCSSNVWLSVALEVVDW